MYKVIMPKLGLTMETGTIEKWHKKEGDKVEVGEVLFEVMTDKVSLEVEAYYSGILKKILRNEGETVPVTEVIAYIGEADENLPLETSVAKLETAAQEKPADILKEKQEGITEKVTITDIPVVKTSLIAENITGSKGIDIAKISGTGPDGKIVGEDVENYMKNMEESEKVAETKERINISPLARTLAKGMGIDYIKEHIVGRGPDGRIVKEDITAYAEKIKSKTNILSAETGAAPASFIAVTSTALKVKSSTMLKGVRKVIADKMVYSKQNIPHIIFTSVMDVDELVAFREKIKDKVFSMYNIKITYTDFIIKAAATVLAEQPVVNSSLLNGNQVIYEDVNIGLAVAIDSGLIVPTIYNTDKISVLEIAKRRLMLIEKAKQEKLTIDEISNATFTISNLGMFGIRNFTAIINPPQGAILTVGEIYKTPVIINDKIEAKQFMEISLAVDHRIIDGADGARYLKRLKEIIENPELLLM